VEAGPGISAVSQEGVDRYLESMKIVAIPFQDGWADRRLVICCADFAHLTPAARLTMAPS